MRQLLSRFTRDREGAVSVDWIVLTAGVIGLAAGAGSVVFDGTVDIGDAISAALSGDDGSTSDTGE